MTDDELIAAADVNLLHAIQRWAGASASGKVWEQEGLLIAASGTSLRSFNNVFVIRPLENPSAFPSEIITYFECRGLQFRLRVRDGVEGATDDVLAVSGLHRSGGIPCLALAPLMRFESDGLPLEIRSVTDDLTLRDHVDVVAAGFGWPPELLGQIFSKALIGDDGWRAYVGYVDGQPVASSQLVVTDGVAGIYYVATLEDFRRRGFGEAMTRHAMNEGLAAGCTVASLQASPIGYRMYERMGFRTVTYYRTYVRQEV